MFVTALKNLIFVYLIYQHSTHVQLKSRI